MNPQDGTFEWDRNWQKNSSNEQKHLKYAIKYLILEKQIVKTSQKKSSNEQKYSSNEQKTSKKK